MRNDMSKLVGKSKHSARYVRRNGRMAQELECLPTREPMYSDRGYRSKVKNATPLLRWLEAQVGRPWTQVYAELCGRFNVRSANGLDVRDFVESYVRLKVYEADGELKCMGRWGGEVDVGSDLYVDPKSGLLSKVPVTETYRARTQRRRDEMAAELAAKRIEVSETRQLHKLEGIWYWVELQPIVAPRVIPAKTFERMDGSTFTIEAYPDLSTVCKDVLLNDWYHLVPSQHSYKADKLRQQYGQSTHYGARKYQASKSDLRQYVQQAA